MTKPVTREADARLCYDARRTPGALCIKSNDGCGETLCPNRKRTTDNLLRLYELSQYVYGKQVQVRLQRMLLKLQRYELDLVYVPGKYMDMADAVSRAYLPANTNDEALSEDIEDIIHCMIRDVPISAMRKDQIKAVAGDDIELQQLRSVVMVGWPRKMQEALEIPQDFWQVKDDICVAETYPVCWGTVS